jgi:hypothetical protein|tara:strand:- start:1266 stop:1652 length:387 start_codon:yes stop_codon:yes gene_type:complete
MSQARQYRRDTYKRAGLLKAKNEWGRFSEKGIQWYSLKQEEGRDFHEKHERMVNDQIEEQLGSKLNSLKETWAGFGYNKDEIELLEEAFTITSIKDKETYREDIKKARSIYKKVQGSLEKRNNAGDKS